MINELSQLRFRLRTFLLFVTLVALFLCVWLNWEHIPGTYYRDARGYPHGTGTQIYNYDSGEVMLREWYRGGLAYRSTWYRPDGTEVATEEYDKQSGGVGYYLRQDGSIKRKFTYIYSPTDHAYLADGEAKYYLPDGTIEKTVQFEDGVKVAE